MFKKVAAWATLEKWDKKGLYDYGVSLDLGWKVKSKKQCSQCIYYIKEYMDDFTLRFYGYGKIKIRPACSFANNYGFVSHNPAKFCKHYEKNEV